MEMIMLISDNPFECVFDKLVHLNSNVEFLEKNSLKRFGTKALTKN